MEEEDLGTWLGLGLATGCCAHSRSSHGERRPSVQPDVFFQRHGEEETGCDRDQRAVSKKGGEGAKQRVNIGDDDGRSSQGPCPNDGGSDGGGGGGARKKLRLTKEQSTLLEDSFCANNILSHPQKQELARQLNLSSRQVEVWFQNRRARTKLKKTEVDCAFLKRWCESLTDENRRLKHELVELQRSAVVGSQLYAQLPGAAVMVNFCPSCEKVTVNN